MDREQAGTYIRNLLNDKETSYAVLNLLENLVMVTGPSMFKSLCNTKSGEDLLMVITKDGFNG